MIIIYTVIRRRRNKSQTGSPWKRAPLYTPEQCHGRIRCVEATPRMISMSAPYTMYICVCVCVCVSVLYHTMYMGPVLLLYYYYYYYITIIVPVQLNHCWEGPTTVIDARRDFPRLCEKQSASITECHQPAAGPLSKEYNNII